LSEYLHNMSNISDNDLEEERKKDLEKERKKPKLPRITVTLDIFSEKIIIKMAEFKGTTRSEIIRDILSKWIESNPEIIKSNYNVNYEDLRREIELEREVKDFNEIINKIPPFFKRIKNKIEIEKLADLLDINSKTLTNFILLHGDDIEKKGLNLQIDGDYIVKE